MKNNNAKYYSYRVVWSQEDQEHVGLCAEFPSLSYVNKDISKALKGISDLVSDVIDDMVKNNETIVEPISKRNYSGKFVVRITPQRHKELSLKAMEDGVSLNHYICDKLASA